MALFKTRQIFIFNAFLILCISNGYAKQLPDGIEISSATAEEAACRIDSTCEVANASDDSGAMTMTEKPDLVTATLDQEKINPCEGLEDCTVVADSCDESPDADACNVRPQATKPKTRKYFDEEGCAVTESEMDAVRVCPKKNKIF